MLAVTDKKCVTPLAMLTIDGPIPWMTPLIAITESGLHPEAQAILDECQQWLNNGDNRDDGRIVAEVLGCIW